MCKSGPYFKLCTCDPKNLGEHYWHLHRGSSFAENTLMAVGDFAPPKDLGPDLFFDEQSFIIDRLLFDINNNPVFDFDYIPADPILQMDTLIHKLLEQNEHIGTFSIPSQSYIDFGQWDEYHKNVTHLTKRK